MKQLLTILFISFCLITNARVITGIIVSDNDSTRIVGANCKLISNKQLKEITTTDSNGVFEFRSAQNTGLTLEISMVGFNPTEVLIEEGISRIDLGTVYLNEGLDLQEVVVSGQSIINSNGRTIVYPSQTDIRASSSAISLFQKLPLSGLQSNPINRTLTVDGGNPMILINGVPSTMEDIQNLQAKDIIKIEFSRSTPARYADQGYSGFLNITLKQRSDGGTLYLWGRSAVNTAFMDGNFNFSYHQGSSQISLSYNPSWRNYHMVYDNTWESLIAPDFIVNLEEHDKNPFNYHYHNLHLKYDFIPNSRTLFSVTLRAMPNFNNSREYGQVSDSYLGKYSYINKTSSDNFTPSLDLFFRYEFNERNSLEIEEVATFSNSKYRYNSIYDFGIFDEEFSMDANSKRKSLISEISYVHNFNSKSSLFVGLQNTFSHSKNNYLLTDYTPVLKENNNYFYIKYGHSIGKIYFSLSSGAKLFWVENDLNKRRFIRNLSSIYLSWNISNLWNLVSSFSYNPGIPSLTSLTDYPQQTTPYLVINGNPDLKVSENLKFQLMPSFQYKNFYTSLLFSFQTIRNQVIEEVSYLGNGLFLQQSSNIKQHVSTGGDLNLKINDIAGFGANISLGFYHYIGQGKNWCHHLNAFDADFTLWWNKGPLTISYWRKIPGKYLNGYYEGKDENGDALSVAYKFNEHWAFEAGWWYMFEKKGTKYPKWSYSEINPYFRERYIKNNGNMVVISISYNTNFGTIFRTGKRTLNNTDNSSSLFTM